MPYFLPPLPFPFPHTSFPSALPCIYTFILPCMPLLACVSPYTLTLLFSTIPHLLYTCPSVARTASLRLVFSAPCFLFLPRQQPFFPMTPPYPQTGSLVGWMILSLLPVQQPSHPFGWPFLLLQCPRRHPCLTVAGVWLCIWWKNTWLPMCPVLLFTFCATTYATTITIPLQ